MNETAQRFQMAFPGMALGTARFRAGDEPFPIHRDAAGAPADLPVPETAAERLECARAVARDGACPRCGAAVAPCPPCLRTMAAQERGR